MTTIRATVSEVVAAAAKQLDILEPGWFRLVKMSKIDMQDHQMCVCGQAGLDWMVVSEPGIRQGSVYAFASESATPFWRNEIRARRAKR